MFSSKALPCGPMDKVSDCESGDSRFESWQGRNISSHIKIDFIPNIYCHYYLPQIRGLLAQWKRYLTTNQGIPGSSPGKVVICCLTKIDFIPNIYCHYYLPQIRGLVAQWIRHLTTNQGIPGSSPGKIVIFCLLLR